MKALGVQWFASRRTVIGLVKAKDEVTDEIKFYLGTAVGADEEDDIRLIMEQGSKIISKDLIKFLGGEMS